MILFPLLGAVGYATGTTLEKISLMKKRIHIADYQTAVSIAIVLLCLPLL